MPRRRRPVSTGTWQDTIRGPRGNPLTDALEPTPHATTEPKNAPRTRSPLRYPNASEQDHPSERSEWKDKDLVSKLPEPLLPGPPPPSTLDLAAQIAAEAAFHAPHRVDHPHPGTARGPGITIHRVLGDSKRTPPPAHLSPHPRAPRTTQPHMYHSRPGDLCPAAQSQGPHPRGAGVPPDFLIFAQGHDTIQGGMSSGCRQVRGGSDPCGPWRRSR